MNTEAIQETDIKIMTLQLELLISRLEGLERAVERHFKHTTELVCLMDK